MTAAFQIFAESDFNLVSRGLFEQLKAKLQIENKNYLLNVNRTEYLNHVVSEYEIRPLGLDFDKASVSSSEGMIPAEAFPPMFRVSSGKSYPRQIIKYHLPFTGHPQLLRSIPNPRVMNSYPVSVEGNEVCLEFIDFYGDSQRIKGRAESALALIRQQAGNLESNILQYNRQLRPLAEVAFDTRKGEIVKQEQVLAALGVPVKRSDNVPTTFAVPAVIRKHVVLKPAAPSEKYVPRTHTRRCDLARNSTNNI